MIIKKKEKEKHNYTVISRSMIFFWTKISNQMHEQKGSYLTKVQNQILPKNYFRYELKVDYQNRTLSIGFYQLIQLPKKYICILIKLEGQL